MIKKLHVKYLSKDPEKAIDTVHHKLLPKQGPFYGIRDTAHNSRQIILTGSITVCLY